MFRFLEWTILDNSIGSYLGVTAAILAVLTFKKPLSKYIAGILFGVVRKLAKGLDKKSFVRLMISPLKTTLVVLVAIISLEKLRFPEALNVNIYRVSLKNLFETISIVTLIISLVWLILRIIDFIAIILEQKGNLKEGSSDNQLILFFKDFFKALVIINGVLLVLKFGFNFQISSLITGLSIAGAAIALSTRESIENLIASFIIFFDKPFSRGDLIKVHSITGTVEKIGLRSTRLRTDQKTYVTVPNKQMVDSITDNLSLRTQRRAFVQLEIQSSTPHETVDQLVSGIEHIMQLRKDKIEAHTVFLSDITKNAYVIFIEFFTATIPAADFNALRQEVNLSIIQTMEDMGVKLAAKDPSEVMPAAQ
ncbi:MAG TPA: mechanosensitive ion channel [Flavitalea sp.]|nr:mechanosensitive ion channel [Flavitalea sp.]